MEIDLSIVIVLNESRPADIAGDVSVFRSIMDARHRKNRGQSAILPPAALLSLYGGKLVNCREKSGSECDSASNHSSLCEPAIPAPITQSPHGHIPARHRGRRVGRAQSNLIISSLELSGVPNGIRTRVFTVKG